MIEQQFSLGGVSPLEFYGVNNTRFRQIKETFPELVFVARGSEMKLRGEEEEVERAREVLDKLILQIQKTGGMAEERFLELLSGRQVNGKVTQPGDLEDVILHGARGNIIKSRTSGQKEIVESARKNDIVFAVGPAGTGKTYTAVAIAVKALKEKRVKKIALCRPAVEAGESLGFLPGDLKEKVDPYLRPLYDALEDMIHFEKLRAYMEKNIIEIVPLAYMRGRTLANAYVILDEAQNATENQLKMFLTRLGRDSKIIITGDDSQIDLPRQQRSGLIQAVNLLRDVDGVGIIRTKASDVLRHKLVKRIISAYDDVDEQRKAWREMKEKEERDRKGEVKS